MLMKTKLFSLAVVALALAACAKTEAPEQQLSGPATAVGFDTYTGRAVTKAGAVGEIISKEDLQITNFGVFAYYHNGTTYTSGVSKPDFMWNQKVEFDGDKWFYTPLKYWPNESAAIGGNVDSADPGSNNAQNGGAAGPDCISFFAYAPYVEASTSGAVTPAADGITRIVTLNTDTADPVLTYVTPGDPLQTVDLLWGVIPAFKTKYSTVTGDQTVTPGKPNLNLLKQTADERIMFQFKHALAKLTLDVAGYFDEVPSPANTDANGTNNVAKDTKIVVEYVKLSTSDYGTTANLNLNNTTAADTPEWDTPTGNINYTISGSQLANLIRYRTPSSAPRGYAEQPRGVTNEPTALLANDASQEAFFGIIPKSLGTTGWNVEVKYHVFTKDDNLDNGYSEITNVIKKSGIALAVDPGKHYTLRLRLGMTSVKFDATVEDWINGNTTPTDLPINVEVASLSGLQLSAAVGTASTGDVYNYASDDVATTAGPIELKNAGYTFTKEALNATLVNGTSAALTSMDGVTLNSDVDWMGYNAAGDFVAAENRTASNRTGKVWATYGGVDSPAITVTQHGSKLVFDLKLADDAIETNPEATKTAVWNATTTWWYMLSAQYQDYDSSTTTLTAAKNINVSVNAIAEGVFNNDASSWVSIDKSSKKVTILSKNESETASRVATINFSYDGATSGNVTITQTKKP